MVNYDEVWKLLDQYDFEIDSLVLSVFKCTLCNKLLTNAYQGSCGCNYCRKCLDKCLVDNEITCPGEKIYCKSNKLSLRTNITQNKGANEEISKLKVKCPFCNHRTALISMSGHLKICNRVELSCPFSDIGCNSTTMNNKRMTKHLMVDIHFHKRLMMEWMGNVKQELKLCNEMNKNQIASCESKNSRLFEEFESYKVNEAIKWKLKEVVFNTLQSQYEDVLIKLQDLTKSLNDLKTEIKKHFEIIKDEKEIQDKELIQLQIALESGLELMQAEFSAEFKDSRKSKPRLSRLPQLIQGSRQISSDLIKHLASVVWKIDSLKNKRTDGSIMYSKYFSTSDKQYKMFLCMWPGGLVNLGVPHITIRFWIWGTVTQSKWPVVVNINMSIIDKISSDARIDVSKHCKFQKYKNSEFFDFFDSEVESKGIRLDESITIECNVNNHE